jgi:hypothetical protein
VTDPLNPAGPAAGWYPIAPGSPQLRWWDGTQWTEQFHTVGTSVGPVDRAPEGTKPNTSWIWIFAVMPLIQLAELPLLSSFYQRIVSAGVTDPTSITTVEFAPASGYFVLQGVSLVLYGAYVVLAVLDYRALKARGVPRPFHWAWTFLSSLAYIIGRTVIVRRRTGAGMAPLLANILALVVSIVAIFAVIIPIMTAAVSSLQ